MQLADVYRILEDEETVIPGDEFTMAVLGNAFWGACDKFVGQQVRNVGDRGKIIFRRLIRHEGQLP